MGCAADLYRTCVLRNPKMAIPAVGLSHILQLWDSAAARSSFFQDGKMLWSGFGDTHKAQKRTEKPVQLWGGKRV